MCDQDSFSDMLAYAQRANELSRRRFGALSVAGGLAAMLPRIAGAADVVENDIDIKTPDGTADSYFVHPSSGVWPGVLMWTDIMGLRPAFKQMGKRLAESGYANPFYRLRKAPNLPPGASMQDDATRQTLMGLGSSLTPEVQFADAKAFVGFLDSQKAVDHKRKMGTVGYCMGGPLTFRTAASFPNRIGAGASFHGANLANDKPDSPHLLVAKMKAQYLIAIAENDDMKDPAAKTLLRQAFDAAGTMHGWCPPDSTVYNEMQAEKGWSRMLSLFKTALV
jgi:carboxymethylenebutenolidase